MGLTTHAIARKAHIHPNQGVGVFVEANDVAEFFAALAEDHATYPVVGSYFTLLTNAINGTARCISLTVAGGSGTCATVVELRGTNQFGEPVNETLTCGGGAEVLISNNAYKVLSSIKLLAEGTSSRTVAFGLPVAANESGIGLPVRIVATSELVGVINNVGAAVTGAANVQFQTFKNTSALTAGPMWVDFDLANVGKRP